MRSSITAKIAAPASSRRPSREAASTGSSLSASTSEASADMAAPRTRAHSPDEQTPSSSRRRPGLLGRVSPGVNHSSTPLPSAAREAMASRCCCKSGRAAAEQRCRCIINRCGCWPVRALRPPPSVEIVRGAMTQSSSFTAFARMGYTNTNTSACWLTPTINRYQAQRLAHAKLHTTTTRATSDNVSSRKYVRVESSAV